jgi:hypothetical protein
MHLTMRAQHTVEARLAGKIDAFISEHRHDPSRWHISKSRLVGYFDDPSPFSFAQGVRWPSADGIRAVIAVRQTIASLPALQRASIDAGRSTGGTDPGTFTASLLDVTHQDLAVFQTGHASSSVRKTADSFFASTSKAAVSASALSLRWSSRSNSFTRRRS